MMDKEKRQKPPSQLPETKLIMNIKNEEKRTLPVKM